MSSRGLLSRNQWGGPALPGLDRETQRLGLRQPPISDDIVRVRKCITNCLLRLGFGVAMSNFDRERSVLPEHHFSRVKIYGEKPFVREVTEALSLLKVGYPYGYSLVQRYIRAIVQSQTRRGVGVYLGVVFERCSENGSLPVTPDRYAASLVRHAIAFRKLLGFRLWRSPRSELGSLNRELRAMRLLRCDGRYFHRPSNLVLQLERQLSARKNQKRR
jgi:hypothetical protein